LGYKKHDRKNNLPARARACVTAGRQKRGVGEGKKNTVQAPWHFALLCVTASD
jgi:hypothetical protein